MSYGAFLMRQVALCLHLKRNPATQNICITFNTTSAQRLGRWYNIVQMQCFVFAV